MKAEASARYSALRCHEDGGKDPEKFLSGMILGLTSRGAKPGVVNLAISRFHELVDSDEIATLSRKINSRKGEE